MSGDTLALVMRILVCKSVSIKDEVDLNAPLPLQYDDGGWEICWIYRYDSSGIRAGNRGFTIAFAVNGIIAMKE